MFAMLHQLKLKITIPKLTRLVLNIFSRKDKKINSKKNGMEKNNQAPIQEKKYHQYKKNLKQIYPVLNHYQYVNMITVKSKTINLLHYRDGFIYWEGGRHEKILECSYLLD